MVEASWGTDMIHLKQPIFHGQGAHIHSVTDGFPERVTPIPWPLEPAFEEMDNF